MTFYRNSSYCYIARDNPKRQIFKNKRLPIFHLNVNSLLTKIDEVSLIAKQSKVTMTGIGEPKLDSTILNSQLDLEDYDKL